MIPRCGSRSSRRMARRIDTGTDPLRQARRTHARLVERAVDNIRCRSEPAEKAGQRRGLRSPRKSGTSSRPGARKSRKRGIEIGRDERLAPSARKSFVRRSGGGAAGTGRSWLSASPSEPHATASRAIHHPGEAGRATPASRADKPWLSDARCANSANAGRRKISGVNAASARR